MVAASGVRLCVLFDSVTIGKQLIQDGWISDVQVSGGRRITTVDVCIKPTSKNSNVVLFRDMGQTKVVCKERSIAGKVLKWLLSHGDSVILVLRHDDANGIKPLSFDLGLGECGLDEDGKSN